MPCALVAERTLTGATWDTAQNFHSVKRGETPCKPGVWSREKKVDWTKIESVSGHTGCHQTPGLVCNRTPLNNLCKLVYLHVTLAVGSDADITQTSFNRKGNS